MATKPVNFHVNQDDLRKILNHIKIAEAHSAFAHGAGPQVELASLVTGPLAPEGLRTVDGSYNNLLPGRENIGGADQIMPRLLQPIWNPAEAVPANFFGPGSPAGPQTDYVMPGTVFDSQPRVISNLIVDQTPNNPAAIITALVLAGSPDPYGQAGTISTLWGTLEAAKALPVDDPTRADQIAAAQDALQTQMTDFGIPLNADGTMKIENLSPDIGLSPPFNSWMTLFGQFFDHGLDLIGKKGGTVYIPLQPDDPLYVEGGHTNFMVLSRATNQPGPDGIVGTADDIHETHNTTTPFVDQNQTYASHASKQVFMREYKMVDGKPLATGHLLEGATGGIANWAETKAQARTMLGIELTDADVLNVPLLATDLYGEFVRGPNGFAQLVMRTAGDDGIMGTADDGSTLVEGNPEAPVSTEFALRSDHAFLDDIAHTAVPVFDANGDLAPDADGAAGNTIPVNAQGQNLAYDNELLDRHFITGDGRGNENIGLTAVHHIFHSEHNRLVEANKVTILESGDLNFINEWLLTDLPSLAAIPADTATLNWDGERLFQAARFATEMQYQHLVFEEFARKIQPAIDPFVFSHSADLDPSIFAEFAHAVYRFGHSMLDETVSRMNPDGSLNDLGLIEAFLNPIAYDTNGMGNETDPLVPADVAAGAIIRGMTRQVGNEIDEFVVEALRNNLLGLPLDLATINITRGRDVGLPSLNDARAQLFAATGDSRLAPYNSWMEFGTTINNPASIINFIAAYGQHETILNATTVDGKRAAATAIVMGTPGAPADSLQFLNSTGPWALDENGRTTTGLNKIDLWVGGLAEEKQEFGGMLGSTFNYVFETQLELLQNGDRFYYLSRTQGMNMLNQLEANTFSELVMRNTDLSLTGQGHIPGDIFGTPNYILEMDEAVQVGADPTRDDQLLNALSPLVLRRDTDDDGDWDYLEYKGADHVVLGGTEEADHIVGGIGIDTLWGDGGNDRLDGGYEADKVHGGAGDDIITNLGGDDFLFGEDGNDVINMGSGLVLGFGGAGTDFVMTGPDAQEIFAGEGNDFLLGNAGNDVLMGNEGDDWAEGGEGFDTLAGENSELFFNSTIIGHDVLNGQGNDTDYDGESGDDIMVQGPGIQRNNGMAGFDWTIHKGDPDQANSDLGIPIFVNQPDFILRDRFDLVEGLSGWNQNDTLVGRQLVLGAVGGTAGGVGGGAVHDANTPFESFSSLLQQSSVDRIAGFDVLVAHLPRQVITWAGQQYTIVVQDENAFTLDGNGNLVDVNDIPSDILLGGAGSDLLQGRGGNDIIDGDRWLNVKILVSHPDGDFFVDSLNQIKARMMSGEINPSQLSIVREIVSDGATGADTDVAVYELAFENYFVQDEFDGSWTVFNLNPGALPAVGGGGGAGAVLTDVDRVFNVEQLRFADLTFDITGAFFNIIGGTLDDILDGSIERDQIVGLAGNDLLNGFEGADSLIAGDGDDTLDGGLGADLLNGGLGSDTFVLGLDAVDVIQDFVGGAGADLLDLTGLLGSLVGLPPGDNPFATGHARLIQSGLSTQVEIDVDGPAGGPNFQQIAMLNNVVATSLTSANFVGGFTPLVSDPDQTITGTAASNTLTGGSGNDVINGLAGNDVLIGRGGMDLLDGGADSDTASYATAAAGVLAQIWDGGASIDGDGGNDAFTSIENLTGSAFADWLEGDAGANTLQGGGGADTMQGFEGNDVLDGGAGNDSMAGGEGDDVLSGGAGVDLMDGGTGVDTLTYAGAAAAIRLEWWSNQVTIDGDGGNDIFDNIERVVGSANNDFLGGRNVDDVLVGGAGDDIMYGFNGADEMTGGSGSDSMSGGDGDDVLIGGLGVDYIEGAAGVDTVSYAGAGSGITVSLWNMLVTNDGDGSNDFLGNVERIIGSNFNDMLQGSNNDDFLVGGGADDVLYGFGGADALEGGTGLDHFFGGADADSFHFGDGSGTDFIHDFSALEGDKIHLSSGINGSAITDGATALAATSYASGNAWIQLGGGNSILVIGVAPGSLSANDFVIL